MMVLSNGVVLVRRNGYYFGEDGVWWIWDESREAMMNMETGEYVVICEKEAA